MNIKVELICQAENRHIADIELPPGTISAEAIRAGITPKDKVRCPPRNVIMDGVQLTCGKCYEALYFRCGEQELKAAMPNSVIAQA